MKSKLFEMPTPPAPSFQRSSSPDYGAGCSPPLSPVCVCVCVAHISLLVWFDCLIISKSQVCSLCVLLYKPVHPTAQHPVSITIRSYLSFDV